MKALVCTLCLALTITHGLNAQEADVASKHYFIVAKTQIENMLDGDLPLSYEDAIYLIEDAWHDGNLDYCGYKEILSTHSNNITLFIEALKDSTKMNPKFDAFSAVSQEDRVKNYETALANYAIFKYMTDTSFTFKIEDETVVVHHPSYTYAYTDPLGTKDWTTTQVTHLLTERKGNCFALASLFKIFSDRQKSEASLKTAPSHIYITHKDDKGTSYNVELSSRSFPGTGTIETLTHSASDAIHNNIVLRTLDQKQSVALCLVYLAKGYEYKYGIKDDDFMLSCAEAALRYDDKNLNAMLLKAEVLENRLLKKGYDIAQLREQTDFQEYQSWIKYIYDLGYREMPYEMKNILVQGWTRDKTLQKKQLGHTPKGKYQTRYAGLSWGLFDEEIITQPLERYGNTIFDTKKETITAFFEDDVLFNEYNFDPVIFALSVDPLAKKYPGVSPYAFCLDNPVIYKDPDGRDAVLVVFPEFKIDPEIKLMNWKMPKIGGLGHAGILLIDNKTGVTKYYEYGRYHTGDGTKGKVRKMTVPNVVIGEDGKPTQESLNRVLSTISKQSGQSGRIDGAYIKSDKFSEMNDYAQMKLKESNPGPDYNKDREPYKLTGNNCGTFCSDVISQDPTVDVPNIVNPTPTNIVDEYQEEGNASVTYDPGSNTTTVGEGDEEDAKK